MKRSALRIVAAAAILFGLMVPAAAHDLWPHCHGVAHSIVADSTYWGHRSTINAGGSTVTFHYFRTSSHGAWIYQNTTTTVCWMP